MHWTRVSSRGSAPGLREEGKEGGRGESTRIGLVSQWELWREKERERRREGRHEEGRGGG